MKLICFTLSERLPKIVPASARRDWMDDTRDGFAYRCLPLNIANAHGWLILNGAPFTAVWDGRDATDAVQVIGADPEGEPPMAASHFGYGVLTFHIDGVFRTDPECDLWICGPVNAIKDGVQPLTGVVETDWSTTTFTMNWRFTRKNTPIAFERDEPYCMIFPIQRGLIEATEPEFRDIREAPQLDAAYRAWSEARNTFNTNLQVEGSVEREQGWQRDYIRGALPTEVQAPASHRTRVRAAPFPDPASGKKA